MRILWFTNTPSNYKISSKGYNGGGWISSLEKEIIQLKDIKLAISFELSGEPFKVEKEGVTYYPISYAKKKKIGKLFELLSNSVLNYSVEIEEYLKVINDFKPDIIEVFGSERSFGLVAPFTSVPVVLHIQGILNPYYNAYLPPFISWKQLKSFNPLKMLQQYKNKKRWVNSCKRETEILKRIKYYIGRTTWDERVTKIFNPTCQYFYGSEILREPFYFSSKRVLPAELKIVTTISSPLYKGFDLVLKTAKLMKEELGLQFIWEVFGNINPQFIEKNTGIICKSINVKLCGVAQAEEIKQKILNCTCFFHPSYIDNSPNSVCEAQLLGCPVISTNVGGIPSLITDNETGFLVPANDPYQAAYLIWQLYKDTVLNENIGNNAKIVAVKRHNKQEIVSSLFGIYQQIIDSNYRKKQE